MNNMACSDVKLLGNVISPYVNRVQIALNLKSVTYEFLEEDFVAKSDLLLKSNPVHKKIPVLIHNNEPICESMIIVQYIDEVWKSGSSILPSDPCDRAIARFWVAYIDEKMRMTEKQKDKPETTNQLGQDLLVLEDAFLECSKGGDFFGGENIGYIDIAMGGFLGWIKAYRKLKGIKIIDETKTPNLAIWAEKFLTHQAVESVIPQTDKLVEVAKMMEAKSNALASE